MGIILNIDTSTKKCSLSLAKDGIPYLVIEEISEYNSYADKIHCFISSAIEANLIKLFELNAICINKGPGSFTGLKIGFCIAKGICYGLNKPLLSIDTLNIMIEGIHIDNGIIIPMIDAPCKEKYISIYDENKTRITPIQSIIITNNSFQEFIKHKIFILENVAIKKAKYIIKTPINYFSDIYPSSENMVFLSEKIFLKKKNENIETFEPLYGIYKYL